MIEINLLPKELQRRKYGLRLERNIVYVLVAGLSAVAVAFAFSYFFQASELAQLQAQVAEARAEKAKYASEIETINQINARNAQIIERITLIDLLDKNREYWVQLMGDIARRVPDYVWLTNITQAQGAQVTQTPPGTTPPATNLSTIEGYSFSLNSLATFIIRLKKSEMINTVEIKTIKLQETDKAKAYSFELNCDLVMPGAWMAGTDVAQGAQNPSNQF